MFEIRLGYQDKVFSLGPMSTAWVLGWLKTVSEKTTET